MTNQVDFQTLSRAVSHALRHEPWLYELELDEQGWADLDALIEALSKSNPNWPLVDRETVRAMIVKSDKRRHEIEGHRIRAIYGHSLPGRLARVAVKPPSILFHGTSNSSVTRIKREGLLPMRRQYVHLSVDHKTAHQVGLRKSSEPMILNIDAFQAHKSGVVFYEGNEKVWLADMIPPQFITGFE